MKKENLPDLPQLYDPPFDFSDFAIAYTGPSLDDGHMGLIVLSDALRGFGSLTERTSQVLLPGDTYFSAELRGAPRNGSVIIPIDFVRRSWQELGPYVEKKWVADLATVITLLGLSPLKDSVNLLKLFRIFRGRPVDAEKDLPKLPPINVNVSVQQVIRLYNDPEVRSSTARMFRPLREDGIESFETRYKGRAIERITKRDLERAEEAEVNSIVGEEEKDLEIQKAALVKHLSWHFSDAISSFDAQIEDPVLWERVDKGERFGHGDRMRVWLRTTARRDGSGKLRIETTIPKVYSIEHRRGGQSEFVWPE